MPNQPTDKELIDALEAYIKKEPPVIWEGGGLFPGGRLSGLGLLGGKRTLRQALAGLIVKKPETK